MKTMQRLSYCALAALIRLLLMSSGYQKTISDRVEVSTALNSWKRVTEGVFLRNLNIDPYTGDLLHETPIGLLAFTCMQKYLSILAVQCLFVLVDLITAWCLFATTRHYVVELAKHESQQLAKKDPGSPSEISYTPITKISTLAVLYVPAAYLFHPYVVMNCVGLTTTVFTNFLISATLLSMIKRARLATCFLVALLTLQGLYAYALIIPATIYVAREFPEGKRALPIAQMTALFLTFVGGLMYLSFVIMGNWNFIGNTMAFILNVPDLRPNIGLYWYFFTEMFEHFRDLFTYAFQMNVGLLYIIPLAMRFRKEPMLLAFAYLAIHAIFKSYPCIGDVGFYMALLPMWLHLWKHMQQGFFVCCLMVFCTVFAPIVWHLWIYSASANANFYFGVTLAFAIAQIFLLTDILFANVKRELALQYGLPTEIDGRRVQLILE